MKVQETKIMPVNVKLSTNSGNSMKVIKCVKCHDWFKNARTVLFCGDCKAEMRRLNKQKYAVQIP